MLYNRGDLFYPVADRSCLQRSGVLSLKLLFLNVCDLFIEFLCGVYLRAVLCYMWCLLHADWL